MGFTMGPVMRLLILQKNEVFLMITLKYLISTMLNLHIRKKCDIPDEWANEEM